MNIYYLVRNDRNNKNNTGFFNKFRGQIRTFLNHGDVVFIYKETRRFYAEYNCREGKTVTKKISISGKAVFNHLLYYHYISKLFHESPPGVIYIRYKITEPTLLFFLWLVKHRHPGCRIFIEFPTFPYDRNWREESLMKKLCLPIDIVFRTQLHRFVDYAVNYTGTECIYGMKTISIKNGINIGDIPVKKQCHNPEHLTLIGVAGLGYWHGYDRVIRGIRNYYNSFSNKKCIEISFVIIGDGKEKENLIKLASDLNLNKNVIFTGTKTGAELDYYFDNADIAVSAIGTHRMGVFFHSALKNREYCARGIPFINAGNDIDFGEQFRYKINIPLDDTPVDIGEIVAFYYNTCINSNCLSEMRKYSEKVLSWDNQLEKVTDKFSGHPIENAV